MKIMVLYDGSESANHALEDTIEYFKPHNPEIIILTVVAEPLDASMENEDIFEAEEEEYRKDLKKTSEWISNQGLNVDCILAHGEPRRMAMEAIEKKSPDVVVVARQKKSSLESVFKASMSAHLVKNAGCDLLITGPAER